MLSFGLITEGITDQIVIEYILSGYFGGEQIVVRPLQPERDKDHPDQASNYGGWSQILSYCRSTDLQESLQFNQYLIIAIDTDVSPDYHVAHGNELGEFTPEMIVEKVKLRLIEAIGGTFYQQNQDRFIFAIAVHSIECWLLPLYYRDRRQAKVKNCLGTLNRQLQKVHQFTIDPDAKNSKYYRQIGKRYRDRQTLMTFYHAHPSLKIFIEDLGKISPEAHI